MRILYTIILLMLFKLGTSQISNSFLNNEIHSFPIYDARLRIDPNSLVRDIDPALISVLEQVTDDYVADNNIIGLSVAINFKEDDIWSYAKGVSEADVPLSVEHSLAIGSISKTITAATILKLYEEGLLGLDDEIGQWISHEHIDSTINIRQCLNHTSGIYNYTDNIGFGAQIIGDMNRIWDPLEIIDLLVEEKVFEKGEKWSYSNTNYLILGLIIEAVTGEDYNQVVRSKILDQKNFDNIQLHVYDTLNTDLAHLWAELGEVKDFTLQFGNLNALFSPAWAAGAYVATPTDITRWAKSLYKGELLEDATMVEMLTAVPISAGYGYGLGTAILSADNGTKVYGHNGEILYSSVMYYVPSLDISIAISTNDGTTNGDNVEDLVQLLLDAYFDFLNVTERIDLGSPVHIYPNPVTGLLAIELDVASATNMQISLVDVLGRSYTLEKCVVLSPGKNIHYYNLANFYKGVYQLKYEMNGAIRTEHILVKH